MAGTAKATNEAEIGSLRKRSPLHVRRSQKLPDASGESVDVRFGENGQRPYDIPATEWPKLSPDPQTLDIRFTIKPFKSRNKSKTEHMADTKRSRLYVFVATSNGWPPR